MKYEGWSYEDWKQHTAAKYPDAFRVAYNWRGKPKLPTEVIRKWQHLLIMREWENNSEAGRAGY